MRGILKVSTAQDLISEGNSVVQGTGCLSDEPLRLWWKVWIPERMQIVPAPRKYPQELRERAMRLVVEARKEDRELSLNAAVVRVGTRVG